MKKLYKFIFLCLAIVSTLLLPHAAGKDWTINFSSNNGAGTVENIEAGKNDKVALPTDPYYKRGYAFRGWRFKSITEAYSYTINYVSSQNPSLILQSPKVLKGTANATIEVIPDWIKGYHTPNRQTLTFKNKENSYTFKYTPIEYKITYTLDGGTNSPNNPTNYTIEDTFRLEQPHKEGYVFTGWTGTGITNGPQLYIDFNKTTENKSYIANWGKNTYTLSFNPNGGSVGETSRSVAYGSRYGTLPIPSRSGYTFDGWFNEAGQKVDSNTIMEAKNIQLTARWSNSNVSITMHSDKENWGTTLINNQYSATLPVGSSATLTATPTQNYEFVKWDDGNTDNPRTVTVSKNKTSYTAIYREKQKVQYLINYYANNPDDPNTLVQSDYVEQGSRWRTKGQIFVKSGYEIEYWKDGLGRRWELNAWYDDPGEKLTLYAQWRKIKKMYTLTVEANNSLYGDVSGSGQYEEGGYASLRATPKPGYIFDSWSDGNKSPTRSIYMDSDKKLIANFIADGPSRTYELISGPDFNKLIKSKGAPDKIIFTDELSPYGANVIPGLDADGDEGVTGWFATDSSYQKVLYISTQRAGQKVIANYNCHEMFRDFSRTTYFDFTMLDVSQVQYMNTMFSGANMHTSQKTQFWGMENWNTSSVLDMHSMFSNSNLDFDAISYQIRNWNLKSVNTLDGMFFKTGSLGTNQTLDLSNWDVRNVRNMSNMFSGTQANIIKTPKNIQPTTSINDITSHRWIDEQSGTVYTPGQFPTGNGEYSYTLVRK